jgi:ABC-type multidrug transport system fused ATPase/permease subunit
MNITLNNLFSKYKFEISLTFTLLTIESILLVLIPYSIGLSIDSLNNDSFRGIYILALVLFLILIMSTGRRLYDTRVYSRIYALLCTNMIKNYKKNAVDTSTIVTRSSLIKELVDFFEHDLTEAYTSLIGIIGAIVMIFYLNHIVFLICLVSLILIFFVYKVSEKKIFNENSNLNTELENRLNIIKSKNLFLMNHFRKITRSMIKLSDIESYNYVVFQVVIALVILGALFIGVKSDLTIGSIFSMLAYVLDFSLEVLILPIIFQQFIRLKEITARINGN